MSKVSSRSRYVNKKPSKPPPPADPLSGLPRLAAAVLIFPQESRVCYIGEPEYARRWVQRWNAERKANEPVAELRLISYRIGQELFDPPPEIERFAVVELTPHSVPTVQARMLREVEARAYAKQWNKRHPKTVVVREPYALASDIYISVLAEEGGAS